MPCAVEAVAFVLVYLGSSFLDPRSVKRWTLFQLTGSSCLDPLWSFKRVLNMTNHSNLFSRSCATPHTIETDAVLSYYDHRWCLGQTLRTVKSLHNECLGEQIRLEKVFDSAPSYTGNFVGNVRMSTFPHAPGS